MTGAIRYTCRTPNCQNWISFHSDTFIPKEWTCPTCADLLERQMVDDLYQRELARKLVQLATEKERENANWKSVNDTAFDLVKQSAQGALNRIKSTDF